MLLLLYGGANHLSSFEIKENRNENRNSLRNRDI